MALEDALAFANQLIDAASREKKVKSVSLGVLDNIIVKARFKSNSRFIDVFCNDQTDTIAYALIENERRIFGADNTGGWYIHPESDPDSHKKCKPVSFEDFLKRAIKV